MKYKVIETSQVTEDSLEEILNHWTAEGWRYDGMQFVVKESARRPSMAFVLFVKGERVMIRRLESMILDFCCHMAISY